MLQVTKEQKQKAIELGRKHNVNSMFVNDKGEFFTNENFAKLSVNGDKEKLATVQVTPEEIKETKEEPKEEAKKIETSGKPTTETATAAELIAAIENATEITAVQAILDAEKSGKKRATVLAAANTKIEQLNTSK